MSGDSRFMAPAPKVGGCKKPTATKAEAVLIGINHLLACGRQDPVDTGVAIATQRVAMQVVVAWKLQEGDRPRICGALVSADGRAE